MTRQNFLIVFVLLVVGVNCKDVTILQPSSLAGTYQAGPLAFPNFAFDITANVTVITGEVLCKPEKLEAERSRIEGTIVLFDFQSLTTDICVGLPSEVAKMLLPLNISGLVLREVHGVGYFQVLEPTVSEDIPLPSVGILGADFDRFAKEVTTHDPNTMVMNLMTPSTNPWKDLVNGPAGIIVQVLMYIYLAATMVIGSYKLYLFVRVHGFELSVTKVCLLLDLAGSIIRVIFMVDPLGFYGIFSIETSAVIFSLSTPFTLCSVLLIAFYWNTLITSFGNYSRTSQWLQGKKKAYLICVSVTFAVMIILAIADLASPGQGIESVLIVIILGVGCLCVGFFFLVQGYKILRILYKSKDQHKKSNAAAKNISWFVGSLGICLFFVVIALIILVSPLNGQSSGGEFGSQFNLFFWMFTASFLVVLAFQPPDKFQSSSNLSTANASKRTQSGEMSVPSYSASAAEVSQAPEDEDEEEEEETAKSQTA